MLPARKGGVALQGQSVSTEDITAVIEKRLFVGHVPVTTSEQEVFEVFSSFGTVTEVRVLGTKGIAFVRFETWAAAHRALLELDGRHQLAGHKGTTQTIVASFAERTGSGRGGAYSKGLDVARVFVGSLPEDVSEQELAERFQPYGFVEGVNLLPAKSRLRCGFVSFQIWGEAFDAVEQLNGQPLRGLGEAMSVVLAQPRESVPKWTESAVRPLATAGFEVAKRRRVDDGSDLQRLLSLYHSAATTEGPRKTADDLHEQIMSLREKLTAPVWNGIATPQVSVAPPWGLAKPLEVVRTPKLGIETTSEAIDSSRLFVGGLPRESTDAELSALASQLTFTHEGCTLLECRVLPGRGCGYLRYASSEAAFEAFQALQGRLVEGWGTPLRVQFAAPQSTKGVAVERPIKDEVQGAEFQSQEEVEAQGLDPRRLFIGQVGRQTSESQLRPLFEPFGPINEFRWVPEKGILYVSFGTFEEASFALQALNNYSVPGVSKGLNVRFSALRRT